jgi:hypothetical protein
MAADSHVAATGALVHSACVEDHLPEAVGCNVVRTMDLKLDVHGAHHPRAGVSAAVIPVKTVCTARS